MEPLDKSSHIVNAFQVIWEFFVLNCRDNQEITTFEFTRFLSLFSLLYFQTKYNKSGWKDTAFGFPIMHPRLTFLLPPLPPVAENGHLALSDHCQGQPGNRGQLDYPSCKCTVVMWLIDLLMARGKKTKPFNIRVS